MNKFEAIIFDLDGTLLDTLEDLADCVNLALADYHCPQKTIEQIRTYVGNGIRKLIACSVDGGEAHPDFEQIFSAFRGYYERKCKDKTKPYDGIEDLLRTLKNNGKKLCIVSNKADFAVKELNIYYFKEFDMIAIGENSRIKRKPAPDMVNQALQELGVSKEKAIYIGDSEVDIKTAKNAGIPCISVLWGFRNQVLLQQQGGTYFAKTPSEVLQLLKTI